MKRRMVLLAAVSACGIADHEFVLAESVSYNDVVTITFDDLSGGGILPTDYAGLTWSDNWAYWDAYNPNYPPRSGRQRAYVTGDLEGWIDFGTRVDFLELWIATVDYDQTTYLEGFLGAAKKYESDHIRAGAKQWVVLNWTGVDSVRFVTTHNMLCAYDNIKYAVIPEPSVAALSALGAVCFFFRRRGR